MNKKAVMAELSEAAKNYTPRNKPWGDDEVQIAKEFCGKVPMLLLAQKLNRTVGAIKKKMMDTKAA